MENVVYEPLKSLGVGDPPTGTRPRAVGAVGTKRGEAGGSRRRIALAAAVTVACAAVLSPAVSAATPQWGYEQVSPADSSSNDIYGMGVSDDLSTSFFGTMNLPLVGMPSDGRSLAYFYGQPRAGAPWSVGPVDVANGSQVRNRVRALSADGSNVLYQAELAAFDGFASGLYRADAHGGLENVNLGQYTDLISATDDLGVVAMRRTGANRPVYLAKRGQAPVQVSVDNNGAPMNTASLGGAATTLQPALSDNALSADGSSVIFATTTAIPGDNDGARRDLLRRIVTPGAEQTILISDANGSGDPDAAADADYRWATADHSRVFFVTSEGLEAGDTDGEQDLYVRDGNSAPVRVSKGESVDGAPTGNASNPAVPGGQPEWSRSTEDGNRTYFVTSERLTQDAPAGVGTKLYERDLAEGRTRFVAGPLADSDYEPSNSALDQGGLISLSLPDLSFRGIRPTPDGVVFMSRAALAGASDTGLTKIYAWTRDGGLKHVSKADADAPPSPASAATITPRNLSGQVVGNQSYGLLELSHVRGARVISDDGSSVFFTTSESLTAEDTDEGFGDVYRWTAGEGLRLVTPPGRAPYHAGYVDSSPDGTEVHFGTSEGILPADTDPNAFDVYRAILGGGTAPSKPAPDADPDVCVGDACQGPTGGAAVLPSVGSIGFAGAGNVLASSEPVKASVSVAKTKPVSGSAATLRVRVPNAGRISVSGSSLRRTERSAAKAGTFAVKVGLSANAKASLKRKKTLKLRARVVFRAKDGRTASKTVAVTFRQPKSVSTTSKKGGR